MGTGKGTAGWRRDLRRAWRRHKASEDGAVTVNWVALTAAVLSIAGAVMSTITTATHKQAAQTAAKIQQAAQDSSKN